MITTFLPQKYLQRKSLPAFVEPPSKTGLIFAECSLLSQSPISAVPVGIGEIRYKSILKATVGAKMIDSEEPIVNSGRRKKMEKFRNFSLYLRWPKTDSQENTKN